MRLAWDWLKMMPGMKPPPTIWALRQLYWSAVTAAGTGLAAPCATTAIVAATAATASTLGRFLRTSVVRMEERPFGGRRPEGDRAAEAARTRRGLLRGVWAICQR